MNRRHSISEGIKPTPHTDILVPSTTTGQKAYGMTAQRMLQGYAQAAARREYNRETQRILFQHIRGKPEKKKSVSWADKMIGTKAHKSLPKRYGPSVFWSAT